jgi:nucleotide-binding universal stress UspA family protein
MPRFKSIVLTTDLSENADAAAPYALELAAKYGGTIHLVHVFEDILYSGVLADEAMGYSATVWVEEAEKVRKNHLNIMASSMSAPENARVVPHYLRGNPTAEVLKFAKMNSADCIVMSTHGRTGFSHLLFGSVAEKIVRTSPCPVLTIKPNKIAGNHDAAVAADLADDVVL